jgi:hypothetical protein
MTDDQFNQFMMLVRNSADVVRIEIRNAGYTSDAVGRKIAQALYFLTLTLVACIVALTFVVYSLKGGA